MRNIRIKYIIQGCLKKQRQAAIFFAVFLCFLLFPTAAYTAVLAGSDPSSCGSYEKCRELEGKEFDMILYSSLGSELVVIYNSEKTGDIEVIANEKNYRKERGTIHDALHFLSEHSEYQGAWIFEAEKTTGWFSSEKISEAYVIEPRYIVKNGYSVPRYSFTEENGRIRVRIKTVSRLDDRRLFR